MNPWKIIWQSYHNTATFWTIFTDIFRRATWIERVFLLFYVLGFIASIIFIFRYPDRLLLFLIFAISEIALLIKFGNLKQDLVLSEYGDPNLSNVPPEQDKTRYLLFKKELEKHFITKNHVESCFGLIDIQIDIASSCNTILNNFFKFSSGIFIGFLAAIWRNVDGDMLIMIGCSLLLFGMFIGTFLFFIPSKVEKLKEMKYFMMLYCKEISLIKSYCNL